MKVRIFEETTPEREKEILVRLVYRYDRPCLIVVDESGEEIKSSMVIFVNHDGTFTRATGLDKSLGLSLDDRGRIVEYD